MTWLDTLTANIRRAEGLRLKAYLDSNGIWTIGYGHTAGVTEGMCCTLEQAESWLQDDIQVALLSLDAHAPWYSNEPACVKLGLAEQCFNLGWPRLSKFVNMLAALQRGDYAEASAEALNSLWATQVGDRAKRIAGLYLAAQQGVGVS